MSLRDKDRRGDISHCLFHPRLQSLKSQLDEAGGVLRGFAHEGRVKLACASKTTFMHLEHKCSPEDGFQLADAALCTHITHTCAARFSCALVLRQT